MQTSLKDAIFFLLGGGVNDVLLTFDTVALRSLLKLQIDMFFTRMYILMLPLKKKNMQNVNLFEQCHLCAGVCLQYLVCSYLFSEFFEPKRLNRHLYLFI